ncbi:very short patch repair endonuclease [Nocardia yamanashiensis]|uniref:very short patch repair endonuclease n=1 Tax=Nocardia yamanashiensis TaxID=209247 RepID=UPI000A0123ED|nr:very short patch repair endonuclease [Nocardia yamanashiensis]
MHTYDDKVDQVVSNRMRAVPNRDTRPELRLRSELHRIGLRYRVNQRPVRGIRRSGDIVFGPAHVAVMVDGCFWHGCPDHMRPSTRNAAFWSNKIEINRRRDRETDQLFGDAGWLVIRVWEHEDVQEAVARIAAIVAARRAVALRSSV